MIHDIIITVAMCLLLIIAAHFIIPQSRYKKLYIVLLLTGVILRSAVIMYLYSGGVDTFGTDGLLYHKVGIWISRQLDNGTPLHAVKYLYTWYTVLVGLVYHVLGINRYIVSLINIALAFFSALLLFKIALNLRYKFAGASFISLSFLFFPNLILWTSDSRKEALTIFICILCCYCLQCFLTYTGAFTAEAGTGAESGAASSAALTKPAKKAERAKVMAIMVFVCILIWLCTLVRIYMFVPMAAGIILCLLFSYIRYRKPIHIHFGVAVIISSILIFFFTALPLLENYHAMTFPDEIGDLGIDIANKAKRIGLVASNRNILLAAVNYLLMPYPGNTGISEISGNIALNVLVSIDMLYWYACMFAMIPGIIKAVRHKEGFMLGLLAFLVSYIVINALVVENVPDTIYRYRSVITGLALLFMDRDAIAHTNQRIVQILGLHHQTTKAELTPGNADKR